MPDESSSKEAPPPVAFIDNPHAPEVFADRVEGFFILDGNIHLTFSRLRVNHETSPGPINRVVTARLIIPISGAQGMALGLYDFLKTHGFDPVAPPTDKTQIQ